MARRTINQKHILLSEIHEYGLNTDTREIFLHSCTTDEEEVGVDYRMAVQLEKNIRYLDRKSHDPILIHMHTIGGIWYDGMAIYDSIKASKSHVTIVGYGSVSSMSSVVIQAADTRVLSPNTEFMIHYGSIGFHTNTISAESMIRWNKKCNDTMMDIYVGRCVGGAKFKGKSKIKVSNFLDDKMRKYQEWYLTAEEAVQYGFADYVLGQKGCEGFDSLL
jgi:ATP-dependent protease ClpP protease subunit